MITKESVLSAVYVIGQLATFIFLIITNWPGFNWWNWIFLIPINFFLACIWPIYWVILVPIFGLPGR